MDYLIIIIFMFWADLGTMFIKMFWPFLWSLLTVLCYNFICVIAGDRNLCYIDGWMKSWSRIRTYLVMDLHRSQRSKLASM